MPFLSSLSFNIISCRLDGIADSEELPTISHADIRGIKKAIKRAADDIDLIPDANNPDQLPKIEDITCALGFAKTIRRATTRVINALRKRVTNNPDMPLVAQDLAIMDLYDRAFELHVLAVAVNSDFPEDERVEIEEVTWDDDYYPDEDDDEEEDVDSDDDTDSEDDNEDDDNEDDDNEDDDNEDDDNEEDDSFDDESTDGDSEADDSDSDDAESEDVDDDSADSHPAPPILQLPSAKQTLQLAPPKPNHPSAHPVLRP